MEKDLFENGRKKKKVPKYYGLRIYLVSTMLYFFLVMPIVGLLWLKYGPELLDVSTGTQTQIVNDSISIQNRVNELEGFLDNPLNANLPITGDSLKLITDNVSVSNMNPSTQNEFSLNAKRTTNRENKIGETLYILIKLLLLGFLAGLAFNLPFKIYFKKKRKNKIIQPKLFNYCKKHLIKSPLYNSIIIMTPYAITLGYMVFILLFNNNFDEITNRFYIQFLFISTLASILTVVFLFYWQRHRVQLKYLEFIYSAEELRKSVYKVSLGKIKNRLWVASGMTTLLPLIIVIFYLSLSITSLGDLELNSITEPQKQILYGKYLSWLGSPEIAEVPNLFYINVYDSMFMFIGIFTGIFTSLIYIFIFIRWTTQDIVGPVKELLRNMELTGQGELDQFSIVRTNDEIGELAQGFNEMSQKIKDYILNISRINQANSRFVPRQFLEFLGKESIADINLGDQVQIEMTILFSDIRSFTSISENMTPKENFDFLNNYLGYMEPVIRINKGFIDKFMGDSIMALFSEDAENAINSAIEMRIKLTEFNQVMSQFGKEPIDSGIGIHTGVLMLGIVGGEGRMEGTVISDSVNLAARLEGLTKIYGSSIIISEDTLIKLNDPSQYNYRFIDIVKVKGKREAVYIFEILDGEPPKCKELKIKTKADFSKALQHYKNKEFESAMPIFKEIYHINEADQAAKLYLDRCAVFIENGVPDNWDGIEVIEHK